MTTGGRTEQTRTSRAGRRDFRRLRRLRWVQYSDVLFLSHVRPWRPASLRRPAPPSLMGGELTKPRRWKAIARRRTHVRNFPQPSSPGRRAGSEATERAWPG